MQFQLPGWLGRASLACALCSLAAVTLPARDVTFVHISDQHYSADGDSPDVLVGTIHAINNLPGTDYPAEFGGNVDTPRGIVLTGDLTNDGTPADWKLFEAHWGLTGREGLIRFPVYEGAGNHDGGPASAGPEGRGYVRRQIIERNKRRPGIRRVSDNGLHYSWDWDGAVEVEPYDAERGLYRYTLTGLAPGTGVNYTLEIAGTYVPQVLASISAGFPSFE
jgi:3',5'-cyclic AMP phosphodiesterase CpdA